MRVLNGAQEAGGPFGGLTVLVSRVLH
jgi:hypothetical protein